MGNSHSLHQTFEKQLGRPIQYNFDGLLFTGLTIQNLVLLLPTIFMIVCVFYQQTLRKAQPVDRGRGAFLDMIIGDNVGDIAVEYSGGKLFPFAIISLALCALSATALSCSLAARSAEHSQNETFPWHYNIMPKSNSSIQELDQAAALLAGATVLGLTVYGTAHHACEAWLSRQKTRSERHKTHL